MLSKETSEKTSTFPGLCKENLQTCDKRIQPGLLGDLRNKGGGWFHVLSSITMSKTTLN
jgi:hypothetical protein